MQRELLLISEMIDAAEQAQQLVQGVGIEELERDRQRRDALLWNFTVMGEAASQLTDEVTFIRCRARASVESSTSRHVVQR